MRRETTARHFGDDLMARIDQAETTGCCREELETFAALAATGMPDEKITVAWEP